MSGETRTVKITQEKLLELKDTLATAFRMNCFDNLANADAACESLNLLCDISDAEERYQVTYIGDGDEYFVLKR